MPHLEFNLMIEGQEGLTWKRWRRVAALAEEAGYDGLFRSDHLTGLFGDPRQPALETWVSLAWLATATSRIAAVLASMSIRSKSASSASPSGVGVDALSPADAAGSRTDARNQGRDFAR